MERGFVQKDIPARPALAEGAGRASATPQRPVQLDELYVKAGFECRECDRLSHSRDTYRATRRFPQLSRGSKPSLSGGIDAKANTTRLPGRTRASRSNPRSYRGLPSSLSTASRPRVRRGSNSGRRRGKGVGRSQSRDDAVATGEQFDESNLTTKRPNTGVSARRYFDVLGREAARDVSADEVVTEDDLA